MSTEYSQFSLIYSNFKKTYDFIMIFGYFLIFTFSKSIDYDKPDLSKTFINISSFPILQAITDKIFNKPIESYFSKESIPSPQLQSIRKLLHSFAYFILQIFILIVFVKFTAFKDVNSFKKYLRHIPPGTKYLLIIIYSIYIISTIFNFFLPDYINQLFGGNDYLVYVQKQYWRPFTSLFLHANLFHLLTVSLLILAYCPVNEKYFGTTYFISFIFINTIFTMLFKIILQHFVTWWYSDELTLGFTKMIVLYIVMIFNMRDEHILHFKKKPAMTHHASRSPSPSPLKVTNMLDITFMELLDIPTIQMYLYVIFLVLTPDTPITENLLSHLCFIFINLAICNNITINEKVTFFLNIILCLAFVCYFFYYLLLIKYGKI